MGEKIYNSMKRAGTWNLVLGIILAVVGVAMGVLFIVNGSKLLKDKADVTF